MNIVWRKPDNTIAVTTIIDISLDLDKPNTHLADIKAHGKELQKPCYISGGYPVPPDWIAVQYMAELPVDIDDFFDAWTWNSSAQKIEVNLTLAKGLTKKRLRGDRAPLLQALDTAYQRAQEVSDKNQMAAVVAQKNLLRNITTKADIVNTLDELRAINVNNP